MALTAPRMATAETACNHGQARNDSMFLERPDRVGRTARLIATPGSGAEEEHFQRRNQQPVGAQQQDEQERDRVHDCKAVRRPARAKALR
jgi:hypothetical protein